jgi:hypothetical protein
LLFPLLYLWFFFKLSPNCINSCSH